MNVGAALRDGAATLAAVGIDNAGYEARLLLAHALGIGQGDLLDRAAEVEAAAYDTLVARRAAREPMALILGHQGFWTLDLAVSPATLIPRADSETLVEAALAARPDRASVARILDLGTGTGCLLLAALAEYPAALGVGIDISPNAAALAARNACSTGLAERALVVCGSWADPLAARFDLVLSNPPYIEAAAIAGLMPEVRRHEPRRALDGGADGLAAYRAILGGLGGLLAPGGTAILEVGAGQAEAVSALAAAVGFRTVSVRPDLAGVPRALVLE